MAEEKKEIVFGKSDISPEKMEEYRKKIESAKSGINLLKGNEPVGSVPRPNIPDFSKLKNAESASPITEDGSLVPRPAGSPVLRPETQKQLEDFTEAQKAELKGIEESSKKKKEDKEDIFESLFEINNQRSEADKILDNKERRKEIEARCSPMKFEDLLYKNEVEQKVPILPGKFEPTYRSLVPEETLFIKKYISRDTEISDQYLLEKYNICLLTCSLVAINDKLLPDHRDQDGNVDEKLFDAKLKMVLKKSGYIVADLGLNYVWFDTRVRKLITVDGLKNG